MPVIFYILTHKDLIGKDDEVHMLSKIDETLAELKKKDLVDPFNNYIFKISTKNIMDVQEIFKSAIQVMKMMKEI